MFRHLRLVLSALVVALAVSGCGLGTAGGFSPSGQLAGPLAQVAPLDGARLAVGSRTFTEHLIVGKMGVILLKSAGAEVADYTGIPGAASSRQAHLEGQLDFMWDYTGSGWISYLGHTEPITDPRKQYEAVRDEDAKNGLIWLPPAPMNNTYGFAARRSVAEKLKITQLSQLASLPVKQRTLCIEAEFANRNDGLQPMLEQYGVPLGSGIPQANITSMDTGAIYAAVDRGSCNFGEIFTTDGRIKSMDLVILEDDRQFFPNYSLSPVVYEATLKKYPQLATLFEPVAQKLTNDVLIDLNAKVDVDGREPTDVAYEWLLAEGFIVQQ